MSGVKKLTMEFKKIVPKKLPEGCTAGPIDESDMLHWNASIIGNDTVCGVVRLISTPFRTQGNSLCWSSIQSRHCVP